ncbi:Tyrosine-protein kinase [Toxocara canis]|uniref:Tyrosine-protein kinase n=1 Tax=Toxocara canis TaxID=6265 RepID=A0A0B2VS98_TOXCA|nr:Tyrosine-protein kinase [Toxocara canis]
MTTFNRTRVFLKKVFAKKTPSGKSSCEKEEQPEVKKPVAKEQSKLVHCPTYEIIPPDDGLEVVDAADKHLLSETYYHGIIDNDEIEELLNRNGDFLICILEGDSQSRIIWTVRSEGRPKFVAIGRKGEKFQIAGKSFDQIPDMVKHYMTTREPIHPGSKIVVKRPIPHKEWLISHDRVRLEDEIGKGAFGKVYKGTLQVGHDFQTVAVKTYAGHAKDRSKTASFLQEARTMREYKHENVLQMLGIACQKEPLMIVLEFCGGGSLLKHLRKQGARLGIPIRYRFSKEASAGLRYLEEMKCIHRDVAARNCLLTENTLTVKISDFGLSIKRQRMVEAEDEIVLPTKWLAPEVIRKRQFTSKTDVWSFGVLLYEIFTDGSEPYPGLSNAEVREKLTNGSNFRMQLPLEIPPGITRLIDSCWMEEPSKRPTFKDINKTLTKIEF